MLLLARWQGLDCRQWQEFFSSPQNLYRFWGPFFWPVIPRALLQPYCGWNMKLTSHQHLVRTECVQHYFHAVICLVGLVLRHRANFTGIHFFNNNLNTNVQFCWCRRLLDAWMSVRLCTCYPVIVEDLCYGLMLLVLKMAYGSSSVDGWTAPRSGYTRVFFEVISGRSDWELFSSLRLSTVPVLSWWCQTYTLKCLETERRREAFYIKKTVGVNEDLAYKKVNKLYKCNFFKHIGKYLFKCKLEKKMCKV
jgi:hypothetical protein